MTSVLPGGPAGDPPSLRHVAMRMRGAADELCMLSDRIRSSLDAIVYEGPAASRFRDAVLRSHNLVHAQASAMGAHARSLEAHAQSVEEWARMGGGV